MSDNLRDSENNPSPPISPNYLYWREHGSEWAQEYDRRKEFMPEYHIQEVMLATYLGQSAPATVLEFGCGAGRHLSYLTQLSGLDVHGYDQSASMVSGCLRWTTRQWIDEHIVVGEPVGPLPYPDKHFDIVFTAEVLVHVRPEHLLGVLAELTRVSRWQVLHVETSPHHELVNREHDGCWYHDLVSAYKRLGLDCEILPFGYSTHTPYRLVFDKERKPYTWPPVAISLLRRMDKDLKRGIQHREAEAYDARQQAERTEAARADLEARIRLAQEREAQSQAKQAQLQTEIARLTECLNQQSLAAREQEARDQAKQAEMEAAIAALREDLAQRIRLAEHQEAEARTRREDDERQIAALRADLEQQTRAARGAAESAAHEQARVQRRLAAAQTELNDQARLIQAQAARHAAEQAQLTKDLFYTREQLIGFVQKTRERLLGPGGGEFQTGPEALPVPEMEATLKAAAEARYELDFIKGRLSYRLPAKFRRGSLYSTLRWLRLKDDCVVAIRARGLKSEQSQGREVWLLAARYERRSPSIPWDYMAMPGGAWTRKKSLSAPYGEVLAAEKGTLKFALHGDDPELTFLKHPWSGKVEIVFRGRREILDLYSAVSHDLLVYPARTPMTVPAPEPEPEPEPPDDKRTAAQKLRPAAPRSTPVGPATPRFTAAEQKWLKEITAKKPAVLAVHVPRWVGVTSSTQALFEHLFPFPSSAEIEPYAVDEAEIARQASLILESGVRHLVCSGGDEIHFKMVRQIQKKRPDVRCDLLWHGSYQHFAEDYNWSILRLWLDAARDATVHTVGTVKKGMEAFFQTLGLRSKFVMNYVPEIPQAPSVPDKGGPHLGIWLSGENLLKKPNVMLAAARMIPGAAIRGSNFSPRAREVIDYFGIPVHSVAGRLLPRRQLLQAIQRTHLSLYVTFTECCPMLPLESLSVGTPCLTGPTSHLFEDDEYLLQRLVVPYPDRADVIARHIRTALDERAEIVRRYIQYAPHYNQRAQNSVADFLAP